MKSLAFRSCLAVGVTLSLAGIATAENYQAIVQPLPVGYRAAFGLGAGDNGMITGGLYRNGTGRGAGYLTSTGFRAMHPSSFVDSWINDSWGSTYHVGWARTTI